MVKVSNYAREQIQALTECSRQPIAVFKQLRFEGLRVSYPSVARIVSRVKLTGSIKSRARSGRPRKLNEAGKYFIEAQMWTNDETSSRQIQKRLAKRGVLVHSSTVWRYRKEQGWTLHNTRYCQMIREANKVKRLELSDQHWRRKTKDEGRKTKVLSPLNSFARRVTERLMNLRRGSPNQNTLWGFMCGLASADTGQQRSASVKALWRLVYTAVF